MSINTQYKLVLYTRSIPPIYTGKMSICFFLPASQLNVQYSKY